MFSLQPNLRPYYAYIEWGRLIPQKFTIPLFYHLEEERARTHHWMNISTSKGLYDIGFMEGNVAELGNDLSNVRPKELVLKEKLQKSHA